MKKFLVALLLATQSLLALCPGQNICSPTRCYTLLEELGQGAYGVVYSAEDQDQNNFALKVYKGHYNIWNSSLGDVDREFKNGQLLDHPRILKSHEFFTSEGESFLSLDLISGTSLSCTTQQLSPTKALEEMICFCDAISYSLEKGYIHIDLHTGNVMLNAEEEIILIDLASFFSFEELTASAEELTASAHYSKFQNGARQKLKLFLEENPTFKQDLDNICNELKEHPALWKILKLLNPLASQNIWKALFIQNFGGINLKSHLSFYFYSVIEISKEILEKSTMDEEQKELLTAEMKALCSEYAAEEESDVGATISSYLERLKGLLEDHLSRSY